MLKSLSRISLFFHQKLKFSFKLIHLRFEVSCGVCCSCHFIREISKLIIMNDCVQICFWLFLIIFESFDKLFHIRINVSLSFIKFHKYFFICILISHLKYLRSNVLFLLHSFMMISHYVLRLFCKLDSSFFTWICIIIVCLNCVLNTNSG